MLETAIYIMGGSVIGAIIGPPIGLWSVRIDHLLDRHRANCPRCYRRAKQRADMRRV